MTFVAGGMQINRRLGNSRNFQQRGAEVQRKAGGKLASCALIFSIVIIRAQAMEFAINRPISGLMTPTDL